MGNINQWHLGDTSKNYESNGNPGIVSTGKGDYGDGRQWQR